MCVNIMDEKILEKYRKAGKIASQARELGKSLVKEGAKVLDIAEAVEAKIRELGGEPAFPVNISLNEVAAHYTPTKNDELVVRANDYVKIDVGVHVDGYIGDTAVTVRPAGKDKMIECSEAMLATAIPLFTPGRKISEIGEAIEAVARERGFNVITNLTGHGLEQWNVHANPSIPNVKNNSEEVLVDGQVLACEPFCTSGRGLVKDADPTLIFKFLKDVPVRSQIARKILAFGRKQNGLPFAKRWVGGGTVTELALRELLQRGGLHGYKVLKDSGAVCQTEHTIIVGATPEVTTE
jgi:methionyl aminopeptidase